MGVPSTLKNSKEVVVFVWVWVKISCCGPIRLSGGHRTMLGVMTGDEQAVEL